MRKLPPNFCHLPWAGLDISPYGEMRPCCQFDMNHYRERFTIPLQSIQAYQNSRFLNDLKTEFLSNGRPKGCSRCWVEEEVGAKSKRFRDYEQYQETFDQHDLESGQFLVISLGLGNYCNLKCRICGPHDSSKWIKEHESYTGEQMPFHNFHKDRKFIGEVIENLGSIVHIDFPGGEPLLTGVSEQHEILTYLIEKGLAERVSLHYTTNTTIFPGQKFWDLWTSFKNVDIQMSIDGIRKEFEFNRYPAKWSRVYANIKRYQEKREELNNIQLSISLTLSVFTVLQLPEFYQWCLDEDLPAPWIGRLNRPHHYRATIFPEEHREKVARILEASAHEEVRRWAYLIRSQDDSEHLPAFKIWTQKKDEYRGQDFQEVFPDLYSLLFGSK